jgi:hypothetical protein
MKRDQKPESITEAEALAALGTIANARAAGGVKHKQTADALRTVLAFIRQAPTRARHDAATARAARLVATLDTHTSPESVLGLPRGATRRQIVSAFRNQARACHPDRCAQHGLSFEAATERFKRLTTAYRAAIGKHRRRASKTGGAR